MIRIIDHEGNGYGALAEITRKKGVNGEKSLTGVIYTNDEVLNGVDRGWKLEFENERYAFIFALPKDTGDIIELEFDAVHEFFYDMSKSSQNNLLNDGSHTFKTYLDFIFNGTGYNYRLDVNVKAFEKQNFGQKNRLELFYDVVNTVGVEFSVNGSVVRILERVGNDLSTVVKKGFNLNELRLEKNIGDFVTYQKGFGAWNDEEDHSKGRLEVEYLSPLAEVYGKLDADPVVDERYTIKSNLLARLKSNVEGSYQISVQIDMEDLTRAGYEYKQPHEGDSIMAINEDLGFQRKVRIVSYETDFDTEGNILDHRITCNSLGIVEESILSNNSIKNSIKELQTDLEITRKQVIKFNVSADGKSTNYYGPIEPSPDEYKLRIGDTWFDTSGEDTIVKAWNGVEWRKSGADVDAIRREIEQAQQDIAAERQRIDVVVDDVNTAVSDAGSTSLSDSLTGIQQISQTAQSNAENALAHSLNAISDASLALNNAQTAINRADDLSGTVNAHTTELNNMDGRISAKAEQSTVDTLAGTVQSLGTEFGIVAGQVNSRVWNTDIETAIDGIEIGGRNYALDTSSQYKNETVPMWQKPVTERVYFKDVGLEIGDFVTLRMYIKVPKSEKYGICARINFYREDGTYTNKSGDYILPGSEGYSVVTFQIPTGTYVSVAGGADRQNAGNDDRGNFQYKNLKLEKGAKATDWTPAPEDTDAKIDHIETEWAQTFDTFSQTVSGIDGRVTAQKQTIDNISSTVSGHGNRISAVEQTAEGLQSTVADKASQSQVTQLANLVDTKVTSSQVNSLIQSDKTIKDTRNTNESPEWYYDNYPKETVREFKRNTTLGISGEGRYGVLETIIPRSDSSGGGVKQTLTTDHSVWERSGTGITWGKWKKTADVDWVGAQISVLEDNINLRVSKGDVINQINISDENILIQANKIMALGDVVVDGKLTITDEFIAPNAQIDGAKIAGATITHGKIASLDASKITTGKIQGIEMDFEFGRLGGWYVRSGRMDYNTKGNEWTVFKPTGDVALAMGVPTSDVGVKTSGATMQLFHDGKVLFNSGGGRRLGGMLRHNEEFEREHLGNTKYLELSSDYKLFVGERSRRTNGLIVRGHEAGLTTGTIIGTDMNGRREKKIELMHDSGTLNVRSHNDIELRSLRDTYISASGRVRTRGDVVPQNSNTYHLGTQTYLWASVRGMSIREGSDARFKDNIDNVPDDFIEYFSKNLTPKAYDLNGTRNFGYIAQDVQAVLFKYERMKDKKARGIKGLVGKYNIVSTEDEGHMTLSYSQIEVLKGAYRDTKIEELEKRIKELENASQKHRIEHLH